MPCLDCFSNCGGQITSDKCVSYTGEDIPLLGICSGDSLSVVEAAVISQLISVLDGTGITLSSITFENSAWLKGLLGVKSPTLLNLVQLLIDSSQTLKDLIDSQAPGTVSFNTACLSGLPASPTTEQVLQAALNLLCSVNTTVSSFSTTYVKNSDLSTQVTNIINEINSTSPDSSTPKFYQRMVPWVAYEYYGSLSNFDNNGKGIVSAGFEKVYLCNGNNGTPDKRGRVAVGAVKNVPGPALDAVVNPNSPENSTASVNYALKEKFGENFHKQTAAEIAPHTHSVNEAPHSHGIATSKDDGGPTGRGKASVGDNDTEGSLSTQTAKTGITINSAGGGSRFNVRQPSIAANFIMYIP